MIGGIIMTHGDDAGLRFPPQVAPVQARLALRPPRPSPDLRLARRCSALL